MITQSVHRINCNGEPGFALSGAGVMFASLLELESLLKTLKTAIELARSTTNLFFLTDGLDETIRISEDSGKNRQTAYKMCQSLSEVIAFIGCTH
jgi:hypothetical protein